MKTPLHTIISELSRKPLAVQIDKLTALVAAEKPHSIRRGELLSLLQKARHREIRHFNRTKGKGWAACAHAH